MLWLNYFNVFLNMNWKLLTEILYILFLIGFTIKIINDSTSSNKAAAYILLLFLFPIAGAIIYLSFGLNYRKTEIYNKKLIFDDKQAQKIAVLIKNYRAVTHSFFMQHFSNFYGLSQMLYQDTKSFATKNNSVQLLWNGENKFPALLQALKQAKHHIHLEYYIYEDDEIGNQLAEIMIQKAKEGLEVRFIYDDFGSRSIRKNLVRKLKDYGVEVFPFYKIQFIYLANRLNYRNHRKIVIIDGEKAFIGGINVSDKYINQDPKAVYWRDTHLLIQGEAVWELQRIFLADWNYCSNQHIKPNSKYFKKLPIIKHGKWVQIVPSGPDSKNPSILYSFLLALSIAQKEILITTPYLIPGEEFLHALHMAVLRGVKVKILVPEKSDSKIVNAVCKSYYQELLVSGVEIYLYQKGFIHAKTMVCDGELSFVGTANLDNRSFDLNFEVNAIVYDIEVAKELKQSFDKDLEDSIQIEVEQWMQRGRLIQFYEKFLRLISPLM